MIIPIGFADSRLDETWIRAAMLHNCSILFLHLTIGLCQIHENSCPLTDNDRGKWTEVSTKHFSLPNLSDIAYMIMSIFFNIGQNSPISNIAIFWQYWSNPQLNFSPDLQQQKRKTNSKTGTAVILANIGNILRKNKKTNGLVGILAISKNIGNIVYVPGGGQF